MSNGFYDGNMPNPVYSGQSRITFVLPEQVKPGGVFIDNSTVYEGARILSSLRDATDAASRPATMAARTLNNVLEAAVLYDEVYVDAFALMRIEPVIDFAVTLPGILKGAYLPPGQRRRVALDAVNRGRAALGTGIGVLNDITRDLMESGYDLDADENLYDLTRQAGFRTIEERLDPRDENSEDAFIQSAFLMLGRSGDHMSRMFYYMSLSQVFGLGYLPHPIRSRLLQCALPAPSKWVQKADENVRSRATEALSALRPHGIDSFQYAPVTGVVLKTWDKHGGSLSDAVLRVRDHPYAIAFRRWIGRLSALVEVDRPEEAVSEWQNVEEEMHKWDKDLLLGVKYERTAITPATSLGVLGISLPGLLVKRDPIIARTQREKVIYFLHMLASRKSV
ncbi:MAG: hypothetical protein ABFD96_24345 [Armatimonadia bacterium]